MNSNQLKANIKDRYSQVAKFGRPTDFISRVFTQTSKQLQDIRRKTGYSDEELKTVPEEANLALGCGNPLAIASIKKGEVSSTRKTEH